VELHELLKIPGVDPKTAQLLHEKLEVKNVDDLEKAAKQHRIRRLAGFGAKKEENILSAIERYRQRSTRIPLGTALPVARKIVEFLKKSGVIDRIEPCRKPAQEEGNRGGY